MKGLHGGGRRWEEGWKRRRGQTQGDANRVKQEKGMKEIYEEEDEEEPMRWRRRKQKVRKRE